ncbi:MAG: hypothetical protein KBT47_09725, partial [Armatimonadetes bacterium]|nr:hypothetical protein [Candidatus Hippobium faecium]
MKKIYYILILLFLCVSAFANPVIKVPEIKAPQIDGYVTEWGDALKLTSFYNLALNSLSEHKIYVWLGCDDQNIYFAYRVYKKDKPVAKATDRENGAFWMDDDVEFVFHTDKDSGAFYQILTNGTGAFRDLCGGGMPQKKLDIKSAAHISESYDKTNPEDEDLYYEGEISVSFESLGITKDSEIIWTSLGAVQLKKGGCDNFVFCDSENKIDINNLFASGSGAVMTFGGNAGIDFQSDFGNEAKANKPLKAIFYKDGEKFFEGTGEGLLGTDIPKGSYILKTEYYDGDSLVYSNSVKAVNMDIFRINRKKNNLVFNADMSYF